MEVLAAFATLRATSGPWRQGSAARIGAIVQLAFVR